MRNIADLNLVPLPRAMQLWALRMCVPFSVALRSSWCFCLNRMNAAENWCTLFTIPFELHVLYARAAHWYGSIAFRSSANTTKSSNNNSQRCYQKTRATANVLILTHGLHAVQFSAYATTLKSAPHPQHTKTRHSAKSTTRKQSQIEPTKKCHTKNAKDRTAFNGSAACVCVLPFAQ